MLDKTISSVELMVDRYFILLDKLTVLFQNDSFGRLSTSVALEPARAVKNQKAIFFTARDNDVEKDAISKQGRRTGTERERENGQNRFGRRTISREGTFTRLIPKPTPKLFPTPVCVSLCSKRSSFVLLQLDLIYALPVIFIF